MTPWAEVRCPRCKGSGEEPVVDEDGCVVRDLCSYCGGAGSWLDITSGPWMAFGCSAAEPAYPDVADFCDLTEDFAGTDVDINRCTAMSATWEPAKEEP